MAAKKLGKFLAKDFREIFGSTQSDEAERLGALARTTIECIARSDALYHTYEHTMLVRSWAETFCADGRWRTGSSRKITSTSSSPASCTTLASSAACLSGDTKTEFVIDQKGRTVTLPRGASDASLAAYHVDRSKLFVYERLGKSSTIDAARVAAAIELPASPGPDLGIPTRSDSSRGSFRPPT